MYVKKCLTEYAEIWGFGEFLVFFSEETAAVVISSDQVKQYFTYKEIQVNTCKETHVYV